MENRVRLVRKELNLTQQAMAERLGIGKSALSMIETGKAALSARNKKILVQQFNVNPDWIDSGKGNMFDRQPVKNRKITHDGESLPQHSVPLYNLEGSAGLVALFKNPSKYKPVDYILIPNLPNCDGAVYMTGDNMYPLLKSGDILLYKEVKDTRNIFWGEMYLISIEVDGEEYVTVRYIKKGTDQGSVKLVSESPSYDDKTIEISRIKAMARIKAFVRMNSN